MRRLLLIFAVVLSSAVVTHAKCPLDEAQKNAEWCTSDTGCYDCPSNLLTFTNTDQAAIMAGCVVGGTPGGRSYIYSMARNFVNQGYPGAEEFAFQTFLKCHCPAGGNSDGRGLQCLKDNKVAVIQWLKTGSWVNSGPPPGFDKGPPPGFDKGPPPGF